MVQKGTLKKRILYGSLSKGLYEEVMPLLIHENNESMRGLAIITLLFGTVLTSLSLLGVLSRRVLPVYLFLLLSSVFFLVLRKVFTLEKKWAGFASCAAQCACLLLFGMLNSTAFAPDPEQNGTVFVALLIVVPFLMTDVPWRMDALLIGSVAVYCVLLRHYKVPRTVALDTTNAIFLCLVSLLCNWIFAARSMQNLANRLFIEKERDSDPLTGLLTKKSAKTLIEAHLAGGDSGIFLLIDIDNFKHVNDGYGHLYGDEVIKKVAGCIKANTRRTDVASRFGGDEFTIFFPGMSAEDAEKKAEQLTFALREAFSGSQGGISCSLGVSYAPPHDDYNKMFNKADKALYQSKSDGKDRYTVHA